MKQKRDEQFNKVNTVKLWFYHRTGGTYGARRKLGHHQKKEKRKTGLDIPKPIFISVHLLQSCLSASSGRMFAAFHAGYIPPIRAVATPKKIPSAM